MSESAQGWPKRRTAVVVVVLALVIIAAVALALRAGRDGGDPPAAVAATSSPPAEGSPTASPEPKAGSTPTDESGSGAPATTYVENELPPVAPDEPAQGTDGVTAELSKIEYVTGEAVAAGEVSGPAVRLTVRLTNGSDEPLDLAFVAVNAYVGPDRVPAGTFVLPGARPFSGVLDPGESGTGVVLFAMTEEASRDVTVTVDYGADVPALAFHGAFQG